jgi:type I restriction enzyme S subunit
VPITKQREFVHVIPPLQVQRHIAAVLDELNEGVQRSEHIYGEKLAALHALKKSLLHEAFSGNL